MFETIEAWIGFILVLIFLGTLLATFLMWYAAGLAGIAKSSFWRSLCGALFGSGITYLFALVALLFSPHVKTLYGLAAGLLLSLFIIKAIYRASLTKSTVPWLFFLIAQAIVILAAAELFIGSPNELLKMM